MTTRIVYPLLFLVCMLWSCSSEDELSRLTAQRNVVDLTVSAGDFVTEGAAGTRATDSGNNTTFAVGDRIGLIIVSENGTPLVANNLPYKYNGAGWTFDTANDEGKTAYYYDNGIGNVRYMAYYPYSKEANGVTTVDGLKAKFLPKADQRTEEDYRASDLMVWDSGSAAPP